MLTRNGLRMTAGEFVEFLFVKKVKQVARSRRGRKAHTNLRTWHWSRDTLQIVMKRKDGEISNRH